MFSRCRATFIFYFRKLKGTSHIRSLSDHGIVHLMKGLQPEETIVSLANSEATTLGVTTVHLQQRRLDPDIARIN